MATFGTKKADINDADPSYEQFLLPLNLFDIGVAEVVGDAHLTRTHTCAWFDMEHSVSIVRSSLVALILLADEVWSLYSVILQEGNIPLELMRHHANLLAILPPLWC